MRKFDTFKELENEIVHFKKIKFSDGDKYDEIKKKIEEMKEYPSKVKELDAQYGKMPREEFESKFKSLSGSGSFEFKNQKVNIKYLANHYYLPVIVSEKDKVNYLNHIIDVKSEIDFINELETYLGRSNNIFKQFNWWMFSKLDETLDEVYIPYYNPKENAMAKFKPDFIFWMQKDNQYLILFVDPKGTEYTDAYRKIDGYSRIFEANERKKPKVFTFNSLNINVKLMLKPAKGGVADIPAEYRKHWFDNFDDFARKIDDD
jgi:hypothetical protein